MFLVANSGNPDQTPRSAASDLGLHCLHMSRKKDARLIRVNPLYSDGFPVHIDTTSMGLPIVYFKG